MRKILLASTALMGLAAFAPSAQAQTKDSPLDVNVGGYVDFRAGAFTETNDLRGATSDGRRNHDFETEFKVNLDISGKAARGVEYGGRISMWNGQTYSGTAGGVSASTAAVGGGTNVHLADAYVYLAGAYGKVIAGDHNGASDLFVYAPTVGLGQVDGQYTNFTDPATLAVFMPSYIENGTDFSTKITYMTPQVGNDEHKVQLAVSYAPNSASAGQDVVRYANTATGPAYRNYVKGAAQYQGNFAPVNVVLSADIVSGNGERSALTGAAVDDFVSWGIGGQLSYAGFTAGGSYVDAGSFGALTNTGTGFNQNRDQYTWSAGLKYEADKYAAAVSYLNGRGYNNGFTGAAAPTVGNSNYVSYWNAYAVGGTYTWFPGMATQADFVHFYQKRPDVLNRNAGNVIVLSQKLTF